MAQWDEGYVSDVVYTTNFYREISPVWLAFACLLMGHRPPDLTRPFRWAELGCGNGLNVAALAAACPGGEFWGFDFNPAEIENARLLAQAAGLGNAQFREASFAELADSKPDAFGAFDFIVAHGVYSWVSAANRRHIVDFIARRLRPGGLACLTYNTLTGWASMLPVRYLMRAWAEQHHDRPDRGLTEALALIERLKTGGSSYFSTNPATEQRLAALPRLDARYVIHEYCNRDWSPLMAADVAEDMAEAKCGFIGSATLTDNIDVMSVPHELVALLRETRDARLKETIRDLGSAQGFRRDIFRRGINPLTGAEHLALLAPLSILGTGVKPEAEIRFASAIGNVAGRMEVYGPLIERLAAGPLTLAELRAVPALADKPASDALQAMAMLVSGGFAHPALPSGAAPPDFAPARALNAEIARRNAAGAGLPALAAPAIGTALGVDLIDTLVVGDRLGPRREPAALAAHVAAVLAASGRSVQQDGQPVTDPQQAQAVIAALVASLLDGRMPAMQALGVLG